MPPAAQRAAQPTYFPIVDALRFVLAFWVMMFHFGVLPIFAWTDRARPLGRALVHAWSTLVYGVPAVICFFVISGFCIHLPFRNGGEMHLWRYFARRYVRILVPAIAALALYRFAGNPQPLTGRNSLLSHSVFWSLVCEELYYLAYPLLRMLRARLGWTRLLPTAFALSTLLALTHPTSDDFADFGPIGTALILLPVWLLGCLLAEQTEHMRAGGRPGGIWMWRVLAWAASWGCFLLDGAGVRHTQTMLWFGLVAYLWIKAEIAHAHERRPWRLLASAGAWSYSLYLVHMAAMGLFGAIGLPPMPRAADWLASYAFCLGVSYTFYCLVERPAHRLARRFQAVRTPLSSAREGTAYA